MAKDPLSEEDKALFRDQMRAVKPLQNNSKRPSSPDNQPKDRPAKAENTSAAASSMFLSDYIKETIQSETVLEYSTRQVPRSRFFELKKGAIRWQGRLDLHGLTIEQARSALIEFLQVQTQNQSACVLIIHGKGGHQGQPPVIKNQVHRWLPQFPQVLAYHSALPKDGGLGAVYVLLARK